MSRNDPPRHHGIHDPEHAEAERRRDERIRDPYEAQRPVRTFDADHPHAAAHPWDAAHDYAPRPLANDSRPSRRATWAEQPARYGGGYYGSDPHGDDRPAERSGPVDRSAFAESRGSRYEWDDARSDRRAQSNSGYDIRDAENEGLRRRTDRGHDAAAYAAHAGSVHGRTRDGTPGRGHIGAQYDRQDTYGSEGYRQQGKRYGFDDTGDERGRTPSFRGVRPRNYVRSDERLREMINEQLTDADLDASDIEVKVDQGTVTLEGTVSQRWMKHQAEDLVDECGVGDIHNHLRVQHRSAQHEPPTATAASTGEHADAAQVTTQASPRPSSGPPPGNDASRKH